MYIFKVVSILAALLCIIVGVSSGKRILDVAGNLLENSQQTFGKHSNRIIGGTIAEEGFAPYQVSLQNFWNAHECGGAIIDQKWILTAGHCVEHMKTEDIIIVTGTNRWQAPGAQYYVQSKHMHCNYDVPYMHNDIALLKLNESIVFNAKTQPVELPRTPMREGDEVILTGWGAEIPYDSPAEYLNKLYLKYIPHKACLEIMNHTERLDIGHICTYSRYGEGACHGDSGGPLISGGNYLVGLVNWGRPCGIGVPDMQANVYFYRDWIRKVISGNTRC